MIKIGDLKLKFKDANNIWHPTKDGRILYENIYGGMQLLDRQEQKAEVSIPEVVKLNKEPIARYDFKIDSKSFFSRLPFVNRSTGNLVKTKLTENQKSFINDIIINDEFSFIGCIAPFDRVYQPGQDEDEFRYNDLRFSFLLALVMTYRAMTSNNNIDVYFGCYSRTIYDHIFDIVSQLECSLGAKIPFRHTVNSGYELLELNGNYIYLLTEGGDEGIITEMNRKPNNVYYDVVDQGTIDTTLFGENHTRWFVRENDNNG
jgi:hypothetical protein